MAVREDRGEHQGGRDCLTGGSQPIMFLMIATFLIRKTMFRKVR